MKEHVMFGKRTPAPLPSPDPRPAAAAAALAASPPAIWRAFARQGAWKTWVIVALLGLNCLSLIANIQLASRPPGFVLVDAETGDATLVKHSVSTSALLAFIADATKPPEATILRFTQKVLHLMLAVNSSTIDTSWPAALDMMAPSLRKKLEAEAAQQKLIETYKNAQRKTDITFEDVRLVDREKGLLAVRAVMKRRVAPLLETGGGPAAEDRIQVELVEEIVAPTYEHPEGLRVREWRLAKVEPVGRAASTLPSPDPVHAPAHP
jgi:hypothetical protein